MQIRLEVLLLLFGGAPALLGQPPLIFNRGAFNSASAMPQSLPGGAVARGSVFTIYGTNLGPDGTPLQQPSYPLQTTLGGVSITVTQGNTTLNAIPTYIAAGQVSAIMPSNAPTGTVLIRVQNGAFKSNFLPLRVADTAFGISSATGIGVGPGVFQNFITQDNLPINQPTLTARPAQVIIMWGTGLGPATFPDTAVPTQVTLPTKVEVFVGGKPADVAYSGRAQCCAGTDEVVFKVPADAPIGCWVPVYVRTAGSVVSNVVTMAIQKDGGTCSDDQNPVSQALVQARKSGGFATVRATTRQDIGVINPVDVVGEYHASIAAATPSLPFPFHAAISMPPVGTCTAYAVFGDLLEGGTVLSADPVFTALDMGPPFSLTGPRGTKVLSALLSGTRAGYLGGFVSGLVRDTRFLEPGAYTVAGTGGRDVGPFSTSYTLPAPLTWTNRDNLLSVPRSQPLTLNWSGGASDQVVVIAGVSEDLPNFASSAFACVAPAGATSFTVPEVMMANFPATRANPLQSKGMVYLLSLSRSSAAKPNVSGLDGAVTIGGYIFGKTVAFQ